ncbi:MAG TPA: hypothetical protein VJC16_07340 [Candidatus Nanoarchaeia archaeon]|nr:hypothetical protein [Candidatus Nanoarchaeia archaeon]
MGLRNRFMGLAAAGIVGLGSDMPAFAQHAPEQTTVAADSASFEQMVEKELRKMDWWVAEEVQQDYNGGDSLKVQLRTVRRDDMRKAAFFGVDDVVLLPLEDMRAATRALPHELWHALYDQWQRPGILSRDEYTGPLLSEIDRYCTKKLETGDFGLFKQFLTEAAPAAFRYLGWDGDYRFAVADDEKTGDMLAELAAIPDNQVTALEEEHQLLYQKLQDFYQDIMVWQGYKSMIAGADLDTPEWGLMVRMVSGLKGLPDLEVHATVAKEMADLREKVSAIYTKRLEAGALADKQGTHLLADEFVEEMRLMNREMMKNLIQLRIRASTEQFQSIATPNEIMGRMIGSLYNLYYGSITQDNFQLGEDDLQFLERFVYKERKLFGKGIEKYRLGLAMLQNGISPAKITQGLEYATSFTYEGKTYSWPEADFRIKGNIRMDEAQDRLNSIRDGNIFDRER